MTDYEMRVDGPVDDKTCGRRHEYNIITTKDEKGELDFEFEYINSPSILDELKQAFKGISEDNPKLPPKYLDDMPDFLEAAIIKKIKEIIRTTTLQYGEQTIGKMVIQTRLPREYIVNIRIGNEHTDRTE